MGVLGLLSRRFVRSPGGLVRALLLGCALLLVHSGPVSAKRGETPAPGGEGIAARTERPEARDDWLVWRAEPDGLARRIAPAAGEKRPARSGGAENAARAVLAEIADILGIGSVIGELEVVLVKRGLASEHVVFRRTVGGVPFEPGRVAVHFGRSGDPTSIDCTVDRRSAPAKTGPAVTRPEAVRAAVSRDADASGARAELVYAEGTEGPRLVWRVVYAGSDPPGVWEVDIDASSGAEAGRACRSMLVDGSGRVWSPNPVNVLQSLNLQDRNDEDQPDFEAAYRIETLRDLDPASGGEYRLSGRFVSIVDFEALVQPAPVRAHPDSFRVTRADDAFEAVMAYYHLDGIQRYLRSLGYDGIGADSIVVTPIPVDVHAFALSPQPDNSRYDPPPAHRLAFGDGCVDDAEDADVLIHEYGHAIEYSQVPSWGYGSGYMGPMAEGFSDYWSESHAARLGVTFGTGQVFDWDKGPVDRCWLGRRVDNHAVVPDSLRPLTFGNIYVNALIWSGSLWDIHEAIGGDASDRVVLESHFYLNGTSPNSTFEDGARAILQADREVYGGAHAQTISAVFANRGILTDMDVEPPVISHTPLRDYLENELPAPIRATVRDGTSVDPDSVTVAYRFAGAGGESDSGSFALVLEEGDSLFAGAFPVGPGRIGTFSYTIRAVDGSSLRNAAVSPESGSYSFSVLPSRPRFAAEGPNPFEERASFRLTLPKASSVRFTIYDVSGRLVRRVADGPREAGEALLEWDGTTGEGRRAAPGVYFYRLEADGFSRTGRLVHLR